MTQLAIGIVGREPEVQIATGVARGLSGIRPLPLAYRDIGETLHLVRGAHDADGFCFLDRDALRLAQNAGITPGPMSHVHYTGASLHRAMLALFSLPGVDWNPQRLTVDGPMEAQVRETYAELGWPVDDVRVAPAAPPGVDEDRRLIAFHRHQYRSGATVGAITGVHSVYETLRHEMPASWLAPAPEAVATALLALAHDILGTRAEMSEIAMVMIDVDDFEGRAQSLGNEWAVQRLKLDLHAAVLGLASEMAATVVALGSDEWMLVAAERTLAPLTERMRTAGRVQQAFAAVPAPVSIGIGLGKSAEEAEFHARAAIRSAKAAGGAQCWLVGRGVERRLPAAVGPVDADHDMFALALRAGVGGAVLRALAPLGPGPVTVRDVAQAVGQTERNARRVLQRLVRAGVAEAASVHGSAGRGRLAATFRLHLPEADG